MPIRDKFPLLFENVVLRSLKSFFQLDCQVDISRYLKEATALCHPRELVGMKPSSSCNFSPSSLFGFPDFRFEFHFNKHFSSPFF